MMRPRIYLYPANFPAHVREAVVPDEDGNYSVYVNADLSDEGKREAIRHALRHVIENDFEKIDVDGVQTIEKAAHLSA